MAEEPDNLVVELLRGILGTLDEHSARFHEIEAIAKEVRLSVASLDLRFDALDERVEIIREGTVSAVGYAAYASREHVRRVEKLEAGR